MKSSQKKFVIFVLIIVLIVVVGTCTLDAPSVAVTNTTTSATDNQKTENQNNAVESKVTPYEKIGLSSLDRVTIPETTLDSDEFFAVAMITLPKLVVGEYKIFKEVIEGFLESLRRGRSEPTPKSLRTNFLLSMKDESFGNIKAGYEDGLQSDIQMTINYLDFLIEGNLDSISTLKTILASPEEHVDEVAEFNLNLLASAKATQTTQIITPGDFTMINSAYINLYSDEKIDSTWPIDITLHGELSYSVVTTHVFRVSEPKAFAYMIPLAIQMETKPFAASIKNIIQLVSEPQSGDLALWEAIKTIFWGSDESDCLSISVETLDANGQITTTRITDQDAFLFLVGLLVKPDKEGPAPD